MAVTLGRTPMAAVIAQPRFVRGLGIGLDGSSPVCGMNENAVDATVRDLGAEAGRPGRPSVLHNRACKDRNRMRNFGLRNRLCFDERFAGARPDLATRSG
jgi:hypothetical protein